MCLFILFFSAIEALRTCYGEYLNRYSDQCSDDVRQATIQSALLKNAAEKGMDLLTECLCMYLTLCPITNF